MAQKPSLYNYRPTIIGLSLSLSIVATILMALRFYTYFFVVRQQSGWALVWATVGWTLSALATLLWCLSLYDRSIAASWILRVIENLAGYWGISFMKLAITMYILHLQDRIYRIGKWVLLGTMAFNFVSAIVLVPLFFISCGPSMRTSLAQVKKCGDQAFLRGIWYGAWSALTDLLLVIYPVIIMWNRRIHLRQKILICILLSLGTIGTVVSIANLVLISTRTRDVGITMILNITELWTVLIASTAAPLWPLFRLIGQHPRIKDFLGAVKRNVFRSNEPVSGPVSPEPAHIVGNRNPTSLGGP